VLRLLPDGQWRRRSALTSLGRPPIVGGVLHSAGIRIVEMTAWMWGRRARFTPEINKVCPELLRGERQAGRPATITQKRECRGVL
jgi:hypothetical protein